MMPSGAVARCRFLRLGATRSPLTLTWCKTMTKLINREKRQRNRMIAFGMIGGVTVVVAVAVVVVVSLLTGSGDDYSSTREENRPSEWRTDEMPSTVDSRDEWENGFGGAEEASAPADAAPAEDGSFGRAREEAREEMMRARQEAQEEMNRAREEAREARRQAREEMKAAHEEMRRQMQDR